MSDLGFLEKLLDGAAVEWRPLHSFSKVLRGKRLTKDKLFDVAKYPVFHGGLEPLGFYHEFNRPAETVMVINVGASAGTVGYCDNDFWSSDGCFCISQSELVDSKYLYHFLASYEGQIKGKVRVAGIPTLDAISIEGLIVPIPCPENPEKSLAIQAEIVRILDSFTELTAELTAELNARKQQYNHYRDKLLSFEEGEVEWRPLEEVCDFKNGFAFKSSLFRDEGSPIIRIKNVSGGIVDMNDVKYFNPSDYREDIEAYVVEKGDILVAMSGATTGKIGCYEHETHAYLNQRVGKFMPKPDQLNNRYLYHFLLSQNQKIYNLAGGGAQPNLSSNALKTELMVPIPHSNEKLRSLSEQTRIANILDKFDMLTTSLSEGLPREIKLRQQQYEYYRDLLLNFPKPDGVA